MATMKKRMTLADHHDDDADDDEEQQQQQPEKDGDCDTGVKDDGHCDKAADARHATNVSTVQQSKPKKQPT